MSDEQLLFHLHFKITENGMVFPYQNEIENLMMELGMDCAGIGEKEIYLGPGVYIQYRTEPHGWHLFRDPNEDEYDATTGQWVGWRFQRQKGVTPMDEEKIKALETKGFMFGTVQQLLNLTDEEMAIVEEKTAVALKATKNPKEK